MKQELSNQLNQYLADSAVLYIKLHNPIEMWLDRILSPSMNISKVFMTPCQKILDEVAEALKMHVETPLASLKDY
ncbi:hypothetical protein, partial [Eubacterium aggregans]|uniref:hypothetical protein n=1 Tax=Eubacterium aggregans TaxID=81409 RepID=UPI003F3FB930